MVQAGTGLQLAVAGRWSNHKRQVLLCATGAVELELVAPAASFPDEAQQVMLARTFGCVRVVWNRILAARHARYAAEGKGTSYAETDRTLTAMKREPEPEFLNEVSAVPLQQALRHQQAAFSAFFDKRARYPRFKSRHGRQSATYTRAAFRMKDGALHLAKTAAPLRFAWTWPDVDVANLDPTPVTVARDPAGRWFVTFHLDVPDPAPLPATGQSVGVDVTGTWLASSPAPDGQNCAPWWNTKPDAAVARSSRPTAGIPPLTTWCTIGAITARRDDRGVSVPG